MITFTIGDLLILLFGLMAGALGMLALINKPWLDYKMKEWCKKWIG